MGHKKGIRRRKKQQGRDPQARKQEGAPEGEHPSTSVYKRIPSLPPAFHGYRGKTDRFLQPGDPQYEDVVSTSYEGFVMDPPDAFPTSFHDSFLRAFEDLEQREAFLFDLTQPAGLNTKVARTFVTRCLVGEPGITYKYLGLRMFSFPWREGEVGATESMVAIGKLNGMLARRTEELLRGLGREEVGSARYNLTLINRCFPDGQVVKLKDEPTFNKDRCTVSWHADSTLEHYSSIAVYHCTKPPPPAHAQKKGGAGGGGREKKWRVALRMHHNAEGPLAGKAHLAAANRASITSAPPLAVPLPSRHAYYLLDDFNHHHQHSVLAGSTDRFASTHRVCRIEGHTFSSIMARCSAALKGTGTASKQVRAEQSALNEVEFEWLRQMYIQGEVHYRLHEWWHAPMAELLRLWHELSDRVAMHVTTLKDAAGGLLEAEKAAAAAAGAGDEKAGSRKMRKQLIKRRKRCDAVTSDSYDALIQGLEERHAKRDGWHAREKDPAFHSVPADCRPMAIPFPSLQKQAPHPDSPASQAGMRKLINQLRAMRDEFTASPGVEQQEEEEDEDGAHGDQQPVGGATSGRDKKKKKKTKKRKKRKFDAASPELGAKKRRF